MRELRTAQPLRRWTDTIATSASMEVGQNREISSKKSLKVFKSKSKAIITGLSNIPEVSNIGMGSGSFIAFGAEIMKVSSISSQ